MSTWAGRPHLSILGGKEEDRFTQYLAELLRAPVVLSAFLKSVCGLSAIVDSQISARTQVTIPGGRPDLAIRSESLYLLCEAKVSSWLHEEQLTPYARELEQWHQAHPQGTARLFVLAPQRQVGGIVQAAERDLAGAGLDQWRPTSITWEQIAALFQGLDVEDRRLMLHLQEFAEIVTYRLGEPLRPFTLEECRQLDRVSPDYLCLFISELFEFYIVSDGEGNYYIFHVVELESRRGRKTGWKRWQGPIRIS